MPRAWWPLAVITPPSITTQPRGYSVPIGLPVTLAGAASGAAPLRYQWLLNGNPVPNATNFSVTISNLSLADFGNYQLVATNGGGAVTSAVASVTVGTVGIWGYYSQAASAPIWPAAGLSNVVAVAAGSAYSLALRQDGTIYTWGFNNPATNVPAGLSGVVAVAAGQSHALALLSNGTVRAWGLGTSGQTNVPVTLSNVIAIAAGSAHSAALRSDGTVVAWGGTSVETQTNIPPGLMKIVAIDAGGSQTLALREDGRLFGWGGRTQYPVPYDLKGVTGFSAGPAFSALNLALTSNGLVRAWGGVGTATNVPAGLNGILAVEGAGGSDQSTGVSLAVRSNRTVTGWGGVVGAQSLTNIPIGLSNVLTLAGGLSHAVALVDDGRPLIVRPPVGGTFYSGRDLVLKSKTTGNAPLSFQWFKDGNPIAGGTDENLVLPFAQSSDAGSYYLVASNALGVAQSVAVPVNVVNQTPVLMSQPQSRFAYYGSPFSVGASVIGSGPMEFLWLQNGAPAYVGTNDLAFDRALSQHGGSYQLIASNPFGSVTSAVAQIKFSRVAGWGGESLLTGPTLTNLPAGTDLGSVLAVASGYFHALAINSNRTVVAWGTTVNGATNVPTDLGDVVAVAAGDYFSIALKSDGTVVAWGLGSSGQTNVPAGLNNVTAIAAGDRHALALRADGTVVGWGLSGPASVPVGLSNVVAIAAGSVQSLALKSDGTIVGWGGFGKIPNYTNVVAIAAGYGQSLALQADGTVIGWSTGGGATGLPAGGISNAVAISMGGGWQGFSHGAALRANGTLTMWGNNAVGQLNVPPELTSAIALSAGGSSTLAYLNDRSPAVATPLTDRHSAGGRHVTFAALAVGQPALNYQWRRNGVDLPGAAGPTLTLTNVTRDSRGLYSALVWNALGSTNSREAWLDVVGPVKLLTSPTAAVPGAVGFVAADTTSTSLAAADAAWLEVQTSTNLVNWQALSNSLVFTNGILRLQDLEQTNYSARFYRIIEH
ncbi:MAG: immunoglobulin domain-containing protein [Verrucomicrobiota bacterium]